VNCTKDQPVAALPIVSLSYPDPVSILSLFRIPPLCLDKTDFVEKKHDLSKASKMSTLKELLASIEALDSDGALKGVAYDLTTNITLGLTGQPLDFCVPTPYNPWPVNKDPTKSTDEKDPKKSTDEEDNRSALKDAIKDVLEKGVAAFLKTDNTEPKDFVIDITTLDDKRILEFFQQQETHSDSLAKIIADTVNKLPTHLKPIIRFLVGGLSQKSSDDVLELVKNTFDNLFRTVDEPKVPLITNKKTEFYVGYYNPNLYARWV